MPWLAARSRLRRYLDAEAPSLFARPMMVVNRSDVRAYLLEKFESIAPADIEALDDRRQEIRDKAEQYENGHKHVVQRIAVATDLMRDFAAGACPQIPLYTVSVVAVALLYVLQDIDVIPDFLPEGFDDDDLMVEVAFELGRPGLQRYCDWKEIPLSVLGVSHVAGR